MKLQYQGELKKKTEKEAETGDRQRERGGGKYKNIKEQMGQRFVQRIGLHMIQRSEKEFQERKADSPKVITYHKLPEQQPQNK